MSVYACLGNDAAAIRDAFLTRLQSKIEDMRIKVMILEFLTVAVETQPGLIELFLNLEVKDGSDGSKEFSLGMWSCLHAVLELIDSQQQDRYWCPPLLHRAAIAFCMLCGRTGGTVPCWSSNQTQVLGKFNQSTVWNPFSSL